MGGMATGKDWDRLAEHVRERRTELGMTQEDVRHAGGPSTATMRLIEGSLQKAYQPSILARLERALQWRPRSVQRILDGGDPVPLDEAGPPAAADIDWPIAPHPSGPFTREALAAAAPYAREMFRTLDQLQARGIERPAGFEMFPDDTRSAQSWDDVLSAGYTPDVAVEFVATLRGEYERSRREQHRDRSGIRGALMRI